MGFRFGTRLNLGKGIGLNISKSGISPSIRTKIGSISTKGFSVKTGISGVGYRKSFSSAKKSGCLVLIVTSVILTSVLKFILSY